MARWKYSIGDFVIMKYTNVLGIVTKRNIRSGSYTVHANGVNYFMAGHDLVKFNPLED